MQKEHFYNYLPSGSIIIGLVLFILSKYTSKKCIFKNVFNKKNDKDHFFSFFCNLEFVYIFARDKLIKRKMRKILYFVAVSLLGISCNRDENNNEKEKSKDINVGFKVSTTQDLSNLQVGERLVVDFEIEDKDTINTTYIIKPETINAIAHQRRGVDYFLQVEDYDENNNLKYTNIKELPFTSQKQKGNFYLEILQPGTFHHKYILEKYVKGVKVGETSAEFLFNAVKITAWTYYQRTQRSGIFQRSKHRRYYMFSIDDGNQQYDNYLENVNGKSHTYSALYREHRHSEGDNRFSAHQEKEFRWSEEQEKEPVRVHSHTIEEISIQQKQADGTINNIVYKNIPIIEK